MISYILMNINELGAVLVNPKFKVIDTEAPVLFVKYCWKPAGKFVTSYILMNINELGAVLASPF